jgi:hypothetical protein
MGLLTLDLETYYDNDYSLRKMTMEEYINDERFEGLIAGMQLPDGTQVTADLAGLTDKQIHDMFHDYGVHKHHVLAQNTMFDGAILNWRYDVRPLGYFDTMLMARVTLRHLIGSVSLKNIALHLGIGEKGTEVVDALGKHRADFTSEQWEDYRQYCQLDVALTRTAFNLMAADIPAREFKVMDTTLRWYIQPTLELDVLKLGNMVYEEKRSMQRTLAATGLDAKQLSSQPQFKAWLESQNVECPMKASPTNPDKLIPALSKTDVGFKALLNHANPTIALVAKARLQAKSRIKETRMERLHGIGCRFPHHKLPVPLLYAGAHTLRYSGMESTNLQNLTHGDGLRDSIRAPEGFKIISADQGQIEARINAVLSGQDDLVQAFRNGEDVYVDMASQLYDGEIDNTRRKVGKATVLGCGYGMGSERFFDHQNAQGLGLSREFSQVVIDTYRTRYWHIAANWKIVDGMLNVMCTGGEVKYGPVTFRHNEVELPSGCKLRYPDMMHDGSNFQYRRYGNNTRKFGWVKIYGAMMVENLCQALARELLVEQMLILEKKWKSVHQVHDEILFVVPDAEVDIACQVMQKIMTMPPEWMPDLPLKVEPAVGQTFGECK